ncbi:hypothetical protein H5398_01095 [Tessaracoccus sp. MC1679]|uniref:hypothetical protein n=1 Tax=Tessaracoccus sp. MC1679 TaxID=2760313 RepID=UPI001602B39D|nr:hypothetical protein [Tessaracoccus sp. MC1679]MBB1514576.1 hypothetical protein [Tessaracoccus sp. MC1679]
MVDDDGAAAGAHPGPEARGSRRWVTGAVVGGLILAAVAIPLGYQALWGPDRAVPGDTPSASPTVSGPETPVGPTPSVGLPSASSEPPVGPGENRCPGSSEEAAQDRFQLTPFDGDLPDGAVSAWLCGDPNEGFTSTGGPAEALTKGVDELVAAFNALEPLPQDIACTMEYRMTYVVVVDYADGAKRLSGELHGCRAVSDGERRLAGADGFLATVVRLWEDQRAGLPAPTEAPEVCPPLTTLVAATPDDVMAGYVCSRNFGDIRILQEVPDDLLARMAESLKTDVGGEVPGMGIDDRGAFVLVDGWGSTISLVPLHDGNFAVDPGALTEFTYWKPPVDLAEELHAFLGPEPSPTG